MVLEIFGVGGAVPACNVGVNFRKLKEWFLQNNRDLNRNCLKCKQAKKQRNTISQYRISTKDVTRTKYFSANN